MSDTSISKMDFKQLRSKVQELNDTVAIMKRMYEDALYNLDDENFSGKFIKEKDNMKAAISVAADEIKTMVSKSDLNDTLSEYSTITQTAEAITLTVDAEYVNGLVGGIYVTNADLRSEISQSAEEIKSTVSAEYQTIESANEEYSVLHNEISEVSQTAGTIETKVSDLVNFKESTFTQTADGFTLDGEKVTFTGVIYLTDSDGNAKASFFLDETFNHEKIIIHGITGSKMPIIIGEKDNVYIDSESAPNLVATHEWVENEAKITAVFG